MLSSQDRAWAGVLRGGCTPRPASPTDRPRAPQPAGWTPRPHLAATGGRPPASPGRRPRARPGGAAAWRARARGPTTGTAGTAPSAPSAPGPPARAPTASGGDAAWRLGAARRRAAREEAAAPQERVALGRRLSSPFPPPAASLSGTCDRSSAHWPSPELLGKGQGPLVSSIGDGQPGRGPQGWGGPELRPPPRWPAACRQASGITWREEGMGHAPPTVPASAPGMLNH